MLLKPSLPGASKVAFSSLRNTAFNFPHVVGAGATLGPQPGSGLRSTVSQLVATQVPRGAGGRVHIPGTRRGVAEARLEGGRASGRPS